MNGCWSWRRQGFHTKVERASKQEVQLKESRESLAVQSWNKIKKYDQPAPDYLFPPLKDSIGFCLPRLRMVLFLVRIISKTLSCKWQHLTTCTFCPKLVQPAFTAHCMPIMAWSRTFEDCPLTYLFPGGASGFGNSLVQIETSFPLLLICWHMII